MLICLNNPTIHVVILITSIVMIGGYAGYLNSFKVESNKKVEAHSYILSGIGAAILTPLFLHLLSSNLIKYSNDFDFINYFVFAGFCFIAGYFSDRFIGSLGEKILKEIAETKQEVALTSNKLNKTSQEVLENQEKVDALIESESDLTDANTINSINENMNDVQSTITNLELTDIMNSVAVKFDGKFKFRTVIGIAKELSYQPNVVEAALLNLETQGIVRQISTSLGKKVWTLTRLGQLYISEKSKS